MSEVVDARQRLWMLTPKHRLSQRQRLPVHRFRLRVLALAFQHERQVTHARQRLWMLTPKHRLFQRQRLPVNRFRDRKSVV